MRKKGLYGLVAFISVIIRGFMLPNPFAAIENGELINWFVGTALVPVTYLIVGLFYQGGMPVLGSILFLIIYIVIHFEIVGVFYFYPNWWIALIGIGFIIVDYGVVHFINKNMT